VLAVNGIVGIRADRPLTELAGDQARRLAISLLEAAQDAERPEPTEWP
jgi:broad specificity phosphatase PhoE